MRTRCVTTLLLFAMAGTWGTVTANGQSPPPGDVIVVHGYVFNDTNGNLKRDRNERGLPKMTVISQPAGTDTSVDAVATTDDTGRFSISTRVGERLSVVASAGYKPIRAGGQIVSTPQDEVGFAMYLDKVVINNRVIQAPPAEVNVSPIITINVPAPVVNVAPSQVDVEPAQVTVLPTPVRISQSISPIALLAAAGMLGSLSLLSAVVVAISVRNTGRVIRQIANWQASYAAECALVTDATWQHVVEQLVADCLDQVVQINALVEISAAHRPIMRFRSTQGYIYTFQLGGCFARGKCVDWVSNPSVPGELRSIWSYFAAKTGLSLMLPRRNNWFVQSSSAQVSVLGRVTRRMHRAALALRVPNHPAIPARSVSERSVDHHESIPIVKPALSLSNETDTKSQVVIGASLSNRAANPETTVTDTLRSNLHSESARPTEMSEPLKTS